MWTAIAIVASVLSALQLIPQAWKAVKADELPDISLPTFAVIAVTTLLWAAYGVHLGDAAIVAANGVGFLCATTISLMKLRKG